MAERPFGLLAEFDSPEALLEAARQARKAGYRALDAFTPFPVEEMPEILGLREWRIGPAFFLGGIGGLGLTLLGIWYIIMDYSIDVGGRPLLAWPAFLVVGFELMILGSVVGGVLAMLALNRLPRLHHPVFAAARFSFASDDRFFLCIQSRDPLFDPKETLEFLETCGPRGISIVPH